MVEQHMGKRRLKEVRQAINMNNELKRLVAFFTITSVVACILIIVLLYLAFTQASHAKQLASVAGLVIIVLIACILIVPKAKKYRQVRKELAEHCARFNISSEDMASGK